MIKFDYFMKRSDGTFPSVGNAESHFSDDVSQAFVLLFNRQTENLCSEVCYISLSHVSCEQTKDISDKRRYSVDVCRIKTPLDYNCNYNKLQLL